MRQYSELAWSIASLYSHALASETRDLAAHIDAAIQAERERCAKVAYEICARTRHVTLGDQIRESLEGLEICGFPVVVDDSVPSDRILVKDQAGTFIAAILKGDTA